MSVAPISETSVFMGAISPRNCHLLKVVGEHGPISCGSQSSRNYRLRDSVNLTGVILVLSLSIFFSGCGGSSTGSSDSSRGSRPFLFTANDGTHGYELWRSDGTEAGTLMIRDIAPGSASGVTSITSFVLWNGLAFFKGSTATNGPQLWKTDGTEGGTIPVTHLTVQAGFIPLELTGIATDDGVYFAADDGAHGIELWRTLGETSNTAMVKDIYPGDTTPQPRYIDDFARVGNMVFFATADGVNGLELWKSDGTADGTVMVKDISPIGDSYPHSFFEMNGTVFFWVSFGSGGNSELWKSDGTESGTALVKEIAPALVAGRQFVVLNGALYFAAGDMVGTDGIELWRSDGTAAGTVMVKDINPGWASSYPEDLTVMNGRIYFTADDGVHGFELWVSDGTDGGTAMVAEVVPGSAPDRMQAPLFLTTANGRLFFAAWDDAHGQELWTSDGTRVGTVLVKDINPGSDSHSAPNRLTEVGGLLYFSADDGSHGRELWRSDGSAVGTYQVRDICPGTCNGYP